MGLKVLILGESGTGKSASMRNFTNDELFLVNVANKALPFKGKFETLNSDTYRDIKKAVQATSKNAIVVDDAQYLMADEFMRRATEKGFDKFTEIGQNYWELCQALDKLSDDKITYVLSHIDRDQNGNEKVKTIGKLLDEKITVEGMYTIVLKTVVQDGKYYFQTQNSGHDTCKSPIGMFNSFLIDNDLKAVDKAIRDYYEIGGVTEPTKEVAAEPVVKEEPKAEVAEPTTRRRSRTEQPAEEPVMADPNKSLAEKLADYQNKEPEATTPVEETPTRRRRVAAEPTQPVEEVKPTSEPVAEETPVRRRRRA